MNTLEKWGAYLFVPQAIVFAAVCGTTSIYDFGVVVVFTAGLYGMGVIAVLFCLAAMSEQRMMGIVLGMASLAGILVAFSFLSSANIFLIIFGFFCVALTYLGALLARNEEPDKPLLYLFTAALPVIGALLYLSGQLSKKKGKAT